MTNSGALHPSWQAVIGDEFNKPYMQSLRQFLAQQKAEDKVIYPPMPLIFNAFNHTPFEQVRVVIIGQDPYHGEGQAHGLSFSVPQGVKLDRKSTRLNSSHVRISYAVFCLKKKKKKRT